MPPVVAFGHAVPLGRGDDEITSTLRSKPTMTEKKTNFESPSGLNRRNELLLKLLQIAIKLMANTEQPIPKQNFIEMEA